MKKMVGIISVFIMIILGIMPAMALPNYHEADQAIHLYDEYNNFYLLTGDIIKEDGIYKTYGFIDKTDYEREYHIYETEAFWEEPLRWFEKWYECELEKYYPEFGNIQVHMIEETTINNVDIYKIFVTTENDSLDWCEGIQTKIELSVIFID